MAFDNATDGGFGVANPFTFNHTCAGADRLLLVGFGWDTGADDVVSVEYGGVAMAEIGKNLTGANRYLYRLINPAVGTNQVAITTTTGHTIFAGASSYTGAHQSSQPASAVTNTSSGTPTSLTTAFTTTVDQAWLALYEQSYNGGPVPSAGADTTKREDDGSFGVWGLCDSGGPLSPAGSHSLQTTRTSTPSVEIGHILIAINPTAAPGGSRNRFLLLGVG